MKCLQIIMLILITGFNTMASNISSVTPGDNDSGIFPVVIALIMLVSAVIVRFITVSGQNAKSGKKPSLN